MVGFNPDSDVKLTQTDHLLAGALNGTISRACVQPLDVLKIRFQLQVEPISRRASTSKYQGVYQAVRSILKEEGLKALWKGHVPAQFLSVGYSIVQFVGFEHLTKTAWSWLPEHFTTSGTLRPVTHGVCGALAACSATVLVQPLDVLRTRLAAQGEPKIYRSLSHAAGSVAKKEGYLAFYKGLVPALVLVGPQMGLQFGLYTALQGSWQVLFHSSTEEKPGFLRNLVSGSGAGLLAKLMVYPFDVLKKRLQIQGFEEARESFGAVREYTGLRDCLVTVLREEKVAGLYKGLWPSLLKAAAVSGISFCVYEHICSILSLRHR